MLPMIETTITNGAENIARKAIHVRGLFSDPGASNAMTESKEIGKVMSPIAPHIGRNVTGQNFLFSGVFQTR